MSQVWGQLTKSQGFLIKLSDLEKACDYAAQRRTVAASVKKKDDDTDKTFMEDFVTTSFNVMVALFGVMKRSPGLSFLYRDALRQTLAAKQINSRLGKRGALLPFSGEVTHYVYCLDQLYAQVWPQIRPDRSPALF